MAGDDFSVGKRKWNEVFKKSLWKSSRKYYRSFLLDLLAISLDLKPSFLFDYAALDVCNASTLIEAFAESDLLSRPLQVLQVGGDVFFADPQFLIKNLKKSISEDLFTLIDVSGNLEEPRVLSGELLSRVISQFKEIVGFLEHRGENLPPKPCLYEKESEKPTQLELGIDENCSLSSVFGFLLGYPVVYWCDPLTSHNCLSRVPLNRYTVTFKVLPSMVQLRTFQDHKRLILGGCENVESRDHMLFSFTAPVSLQPYFHSRVQCWMSRIWDLGRDLGIANCLELKETIVSFTNLIL